MKKRKKNDVAALLDYAGRCKGLTFLGLGVDPMIPSWGGMLADGRTYMQTAWWVSVFPGLAIMLTVLGLNLLGDWLRDALNPRLN